MSECFLYSYSYTTLFHRLVPLSLSGIQFGTVWQRSYCKVQNSHFSSIIIEGPYCIVSSWKFMIPDLLRLLQINILTIRSQLYVKSNYDPQHRNPPQSTLFYYRKSSNKRHPQISAHHLNLKKEALTGNFSKIEFLIRNF